jgi:hypothetical protein
VLSVLVTLSGQVVSAARLCKDETFAVKVSPIAWLRLFKTWQLGVEDPKEGSCWGPKYRLDGFYKLHKLGRPLGGGVAGSCTQDESD